MLFNQQGRAFAGYYYGEGDSPYYPADIDDYALKYFGPSRYQMCIRDRLSTPSTYTAVEIQLDWAEQRVLETTLFPLGLLKFQFHYLRPAGERCV